jgi:mono/diheme cytochrome c family protein
VLKALAIVVAVIVLGAAAGWLWLTVDQGAVAAQRGSALDPEDFAQIERGRYLTTAADCEGCHTSGQGLFAGGRPIETPFGKMFGPNITPDRETGIGAWSDDEFVAAVKKGRRPDGSRLYPAMPFVYYTKLSKDDVLAIRAYLNKQKAVHHLVVANNLPFPFDIRASMRVWDMLFFKEGDFRPDLAKSSEWNRGAYLVEGAGHCGACHTPKNWLGGDETSRKLQGYTLQGWFAPNLQNDDATGLGRWSKADIVAYLKTGHTAFTAATGTMAEEISLSSSRMNDADLNAIGAYLKDQPESKQSAKTASAASSSLLQAGAAVYKDECSACHAGDGKGVPNLFPSLAASSNVRSSDPTSLIRIVLEGARSVATSAEPTSPAMPAFAWQLSDAQVAAVLTFVRNNWGAKAAPVSEDEVRRARSKISSQEPQKTHS